jgi:hypothetical protein
MQQDTMVFVLKRTVELPIRKRRSLNRHISATSVSVGLSLGPPT